MKLYLANTQGLDPAGARCPPRSGRRGSAFGVSLLALALEEAGIPGEPRLGEDARGKPVFPDYPELCFSLSHSGDYVACALGNVPLGVDVQCRRPLSPTLSRLARDEAAGGLEFFVLWTMRESLFKITGEGDLRHISFRRDAEGRIFAPDFPGLRFANYDIGSAAALSLAWEAPVPAPTLTVVSGVELLAENIVTEEKNARQY